MDELNEEIAALDVSSTPRRSLRKRMFTETPPTPPAKRSKRKNSPSSLAELNKFYTNKSTRFARNGLETIYEDPQPGKNGTLVLTGGSKIRRSLNLDKQRAELATKSKRLSRKKRIKLFGVGANRRNKLPDEDVKRRLKLVDAFLRTEPEEITVITNFQEKSLRVPETQILRINDETVMDSNQDLLLVNVQHELEGME